MIKEIENYLLNLQENICLEAKNIENGKKFIIDSWQKSEIKGYGKTNTLENGKVFERAGVNFSYIKGENIPSSASSIRPELAGRKYQALGLSLVMHPLNPYAPTAHLNVRFFITYQAGKDDIWWFGGGYDLTPYYPFHEDVIHWHSEAKKACMPFGKNLYKKYKQNCDDYFYLKHRDEQRGVGGLFFDDFNEKDFANSFAFMQSVGNSFAKAYFPIIQKRKDNTFTKKQRDFQLYRRGRYVEFNLIFDRGTLFGLQSKGRVESILVSMPPKVSWQYNLKPKENSIEEKLYKYYLKPQKWIDY